MKGSDPTTHHASPRQGSKPEGAPGGDLQEYIRRLATVLGVIVENPAKKENAIRIIQGNITNLKRLTLKPEKKQEAALILKIHESVLGLIKQIENLEWKVEAQKKALSEEEHLENDLVTSIIDMKEFEEVKKNYEKIKQDYDLVLQKKEEIAKELVETRDRLEKTTKELNLLRHEINTAYIPMEQHAAEISVIEARYATQLAQRAQNEGSVSEQEIKKLREENEQLTAKIKELLNELERTREEGISDIREWYLDQLKKYRGTFDQIINEKESLSNLLREEVEKRQKMELLLAEYKQKIESGVYLPKERVEAEIKRLNDAIREAEEKRRSAEELQSRLKDDIIRLHILEKEVQEKDAQIQWLKAKIGDEKISHDAELQEIEARYNQRIKELEKTFELKSLKEKEAMAAEIERLKKEMASLLQATREHIRRT